MKQINKLFIAAAVLGGFTLTTTVARADAPAAPAAAATTYKDNGTPWYYLDIVTSSCEPMPAYAATPDKYKAWMEANKGSVSDFKVMITDKRGTWVSFNAVWAKGTQVPVMMIQSKDFCQTVLDSQTKQGFMPMAPGSEAAATPAEAPKS